MAAGLVGPSRDLAEPVALSPTVRHSLAEGRNKFPKVIYVKIVSRVLYRIELRVLGIEEIRVSPILRPSESS